MEQKVIQLYQLHKKANKEFDDIMVFVVFFFFPRGFVSSARVRTHGLGVVTVGDDKWGLSGFAPLLRDFFTDARCRRVMDKCMNIAPHGR